MIFQALIAFALAFGTLAPLQAQPASGAATAPGSADTATGTDVAKDLPSDAALLREHLAQGEQAPPGQGSASQSLQKARPSVQANSPEGNGLPRPTQGAREEGDVANAVRDFVRPLHQEISNSSVVQVVREIDAAVGATNQADRAQVPPGYAPRGTYSPGAAPGTAPGTAQRGREVDPHAVSLMWQELLEEVVPWALAGAVVAVLAYGGFFWLKVIKFKNSKQGDKRRDARKSGRRLSRMSHSAAVVESAQDEMASRVSAAMPRKSSSDSLDRSSRRGSSREQGREQGREPSRTSSQSASRIGNHNPDGAIR